MSKVQMIAQAFKGTVVEDQGYRGIIFVDDTNEHIRWHAAYGVHAVKRLAKTWRVSRSILTADEVDPFLREAGVLSNTTAVANPLDSLAEALGGEVIQRFHAGGGVVKTEKGLYLRYSNITGLDVVELIVTKWRCLKHVASRSETLKALLESRVPQLLETPEEETVHGT